MRSASSSSLAMAALFSNPWPNPHPSSIKENTMSNELITAAQARENVNKAATISTPESTAILEAISDRIKEASDLGHVAISWGFNYKDKEELPRVFHALRKAGYSVECTSTVNRTYIIFWGLAEA